MATTNDTNDNTGNELPRITSASDLLAAYAAWRRDFRDADLTDADLRGAVLTGADLTDADLTRADLTDANLTYANLTGADLTYADLRDAVLTRADLTGADLAGADLRGTNLSGIIGLLDPAAWLSEHCERDADGLIVYKTFGLHFTSPNTWTIAAGSVITEVVNPDCGTDCACGINVSTLAWQRQQGHTRAWRCRITWMDLAGVVVPFGTDGKFRCARLELIEEVDLTTAVDSVDDTPERAEV